MDKNRIWVFEDEGYIVRIGYDATLNYADRDYSRTLLNMGLHVEVDGYWFFIGPEGYMWQYPAEMYEQREWRRSSQWRYNVAIWTKWYLAQYPDNSDHWHKSVHEVNIRAMHALQRKYDEVLNRVSLVKDDTKVIAA